MSILFKTRDAVNQMSKLLKIFVESLRGDKDKYKSVERWKSPGRITELGIHILSETVRKSITETTKGSKSK